MLYINAHRRRHLADANTKSKPKENTNLVLPTKKRKSQLRTHLVVDETAGGRAEEDQGDGMEKALVAARVERMGDACITIMFP